MEATNWNKKTVQHGRHADKNEHAALYGTYTYFTFKSWYFFVLYLILNPFFVFYRIVTKVFYIYYHICCCVSWVAERVFPCTLLVDVLLIQKQQQLFVTSESNMESLGWFSLRCRILITIYPLSLFLCSPWKIIVITKPPPPPPPSPQPFMKIRSRECLIRRDSR